MRFALLLELAPRSASLMSSSSFDIDKDSRTRRSRKDFLTEFTSESVEGQTKIHQKFRESVAAFEAFSSFHHFFDLSEDFLAFNFESYSLT